MRTFTKRRLRLRSLLRRDMVEHELDAEMAFYLEQQIEENIAAGMNPREARLAALQVIGGIAQLQEECRDMRRVKLIENFLQDLRYAFKSLVKSPGFAAIAILTLSLGIGASIAILTVINSVLLRNLPFPNASHLVVLFATNVTRGVLRDTTSFPYFVDWQSQSHAFTSMAAWRSDRMNVTGGGAPRPITGLRASWELFGVLG